MDWLCHVRNKIMYVLSQRTVYALTWVLFWCLFPSLLCNSGNKHQNNPLVSALTICHLSTFVILYICCEYLGEKWMCYDGTLPWTHLLSTMMTWFLHYWPFVRGIHWSPVDSPHTGPVRWSFDVIFAHSLNKLNEWLCCKTFHIITHMWHDSNGKMNITPLLTLKFLYTTLTHQAI